MTLQQFIDRWTSGGIDFDGSFGFQCQDLYREYVKEVLNVPQSPPVVGAKDNWNKYLPEYFDRIENTPDGIPEPGDIVIWGESYGPFGHVAVFVKGTAKTLTCFSQNDPLGALCGLKTYRSYRGVLGWLRCKMSNEPITQDLDIRLKILDENNIKTEGEIRELLGAKAELPKLREDKLNADKEIERLRHQVGQDKSDLKMESDANIALKSAHENHLDSIGKAVGNGPDLPGILQHISLLASKADLADKYEKELGSVRNHNADLKAEIQRKNDAFTSLSLKLDSTGAEINKLKAVVGDWLNLTEVNEQTVLGALHGRTDPSIFDAIISTIRRITKKWRN